MKAASTRRSNSNKWREAYSHEVISHGFWRARLGGDPNVLHRTVTLDDVLATKVLRANASALYHIAL